MLQGLTTVPCVLYCINVGLLNGCITQTLVDHEYDKWAQAILHPQLD